MYSRPLRSLVYCLTNSTSQVLARFFGKGNRVAMAVIRCCKTFLFPIIVNYRFQKSARPDSKLSISFYDIDENTSLEDILSEVKNIHSIHFPD